VGNRPHQRRHRDKKGKVWSIEAAVVDEQPVRSKGHRPLAAKKKKGGDVRFPHQEKALGEQRRKEKKNAPLVERKEVPKGPTQTFSAPTPPARKGGIHRSHLHQAKKKRKNQGALPSLFIPPDVGENVPVRERGKKRCRDLPSSQRGENSSTLTSTPKSLRCASKKEKEGGNGSPPSYPRRKKEKEQKDIHPPPPKKGRHPKEKRKRDQRSP